MEKQFEGKVALVTGGAFGIGRATAIEFARRGAKVVVSDIIEDKETMNAIEELKGDAIFVKCDVGKREDIERLMKKTVEHFGRLDYAFNNAGIEGEAGDTQTCTEENWDRTININLKGVWLCMKYQIPIMLKQNGGAIVNCASIAGLVGFPNLPAYTSSKHAVVGLTKTAALETAKQNIRINAVCPGVIRTPMIDRFTGKQKEAEQAFIDNKPMGRMGDPSEVATAVMWMCSDESSFVTGQAVAVDGGWIVQ
ncbi:MAG: SDR family oxidoreductase [Saprospirales bacterium]|nr:MAG: SDR family oxidoreductase [Saprospirales bacterium]